MEARLRTLGVSTLKLWKRIDPLIIGIVLALLVGLFVPIPREAANVIDVVADIAVALVFLFYGMRLSPKETLHGMTNIKLQSLVLLVTFVVFPLLGLALSWATAPVIGASFALGIIYLSILPTTIQSAPSFVSLARGDIAAAIAASTFSNILAMFLTPFLVFVLMDLEGAQTSGLQSILLKLLLPFIVGQFLQPWFGNWVRAHAKLTKTTNTVAIILVVLAAVVTATLDNAWSAVSFDGFVVLTLILGAFLALMLGITWWLARAAKLPAQEKSVLTISGAQKSLATGLPMAKAIMDPAIVGAIAIPVIIYHQLQLIVCAVLANRMGRAVENSEE